MTLRTAHPLCPMCDSARIEVRNDRSTRYRYLGKDHVVDKQQHTVCLTCGTSFFLPGQIDYNNARMKEVAKKFIKHIAPWEIVALREMYSLTQDDACRVFQCGSKTQFSKWERGEVAPTGTAALALREALENPAFMCRLAEKAKVSIAAEIPAPKARLGKLELAGSGIGVVACYAMADNSPIMTEAGSTEDRTTFGHGHQSNRWVNAISGSRRGPVRHQ